MNFFELIHPFAKKENPPTQPAPLTEPSLNDEMRRELQVMQNQLDGLLEQCPAQAAELYAAGLQPIKIELARARQELTFFQYPLEDLLTQNVRGYTPPSWCSGEYGLFIADLGRYQEALALQSIKARLKEVGVDMEHLAELVRADERFANELSDESEEDLPVVAAEPPGPLLIPEEEEPLEDRSQWRGGVARVIDVAFFPPSTAEPSPSRQELQRIAQRVFCTVAELRATVTQTTAPDEIKAEIAKSSYRLGKVASARTISNCEAFQRPITQAVLEQLLRVIAWSEAMESVLNARNQLYSAAFGRERGSQLRQLRDQIKQVAQAAINNHSGQLIDNFSPVRLGVLLAALSKYRLELTELGTTVDSAYTAATEMLQAANQLIGAACEQLTAAISTQ